MIEISLRPLHRLCVLSSEHVQRAPGTFPVRRKCLRPAHFLAPEQCAICLPVAVLCAGISHRGSTDAAATLQLPPEIWAFWPRGVSSVMLRATEEAPSSFTVRIPVPRAANARHCACGWNVATPVCLWFPHAFLWFSHGISDIHMEPPVFT
jgi:hypothetical protein